jgi:hypothetical protein
MGSDQCLGLNPQRLGAGQQVRLMRHQEIHERDQHLAPRRVPGAQPLAQLVGRNAGQRDQPVGMILVRQDPAQGGERQRLGVGGGLMRIAKN